VYLLEEKTHETVLEINLNAISYNLNFFKSKLKPNVKNMVMVRHLVMGMGLEISLTPQGGYLVADEGISLKNGGIQLPIMVLNRRTQFSAIIQYQLEPEIYCLKGL
jgi:alanine racemase